MTQSSDQLKAAFVVDLVAMATGVSASEIAANGRGSARAARARMVVMYLLNVELEWSLQRVGDVLNRDRTTVMHASPVIEDLRDDPVFDECLNALGAVVRAAPEPGCLASMDIGHHLIPQRMTA